MKFVSSSRGGKSGKVTPARLCHTQVRPFPPQVIGNCQPTTTCLGDSICLSWPSTPLPASSSQEGQIYSDLGGEKHSFTLLCCITYRAVSSPTSPGSQVLMSQKVGGHRDLSASHVPSSSVRGSPTALSDQHSTKPGPS